METSGGIQASLSGRYAVALFDLARDAQSLDTVAGSLAALKAALDKAGYPATVIESNAPPPPAAAPAGLPGWWPAAVGAVLTLPLMLPMLLQPLVENAIKHGLEPKVGAGSIDVEATLHAACIELRVSDNGKGVEPALRDHLPSQQHGQPDHSGEDSAPRSRQGQGDAEHGRQAQR